MPVHVGWAGQVPCCLQFLLSEQTDFKEQQNAIQELVLSQGHFCIFLPKFHPELNFIGRYWSRVKWYARQYSWPLYTSDAADDTPCVALGGRRSITEKRAVTYDEVIM